MQTVELLAVVTLGSIFATLTAAQLTKTDRQTFLDKHNEYRKNVSPTGTKIKKMQWSFDLETMSQIWAEKCQFEHGQPTCSNKPHSYIGQNLYLTSGTTYKPASVVTAWKDEVNYYTFSTNACSKVCGHYTQVVWHSSYQLGCGAKYCPGTGYLVVCNYGPAGNYAGSRPYTSGTACSACPSGNTCSDNMCVDGSLNYTIPNDAPVTSMVCEGGATTTAPGGGTVTEAPGTGSNVTTGDSTPPPSGLPSGASKLVALYVPLTLLFIIVWEIGKYCQ